MGRININFFFLTFIIALLILVGCEQKPKQKLKVKIKKLVTSRKILAKKQEIINTYRTTSELIAIKEVTLSAEISGKIIERNIYTGDFVEQGQLLYRIDRDFLDIEHQRLHEKILLQQVHISETKTNLQRQKRLGIATTTQKLENAHTRHLIAQKNLAILQQNLREIDLKITKTSLYAPFSGEISKFFFKRDELVQNSQPIVSLIDRSTLKAIAGIPENLLAQIKNSRIIVNVPSLKKRYTSQIFCIYPKINNNTKKVSIEIHIPNKNKQLYSGMFCEINFSLRKKEAIIVPLNFVKEAYGMHFVQIVEKNIIIKKKISAIIYNDKWLIKKGVKEGQELQEY